MSTTFAGPVISQGGFIGGGELGGPGGRHFYVNPNTGSAARNAERPWYDVDEDLVFSTHQGAIDACVSDRGDVIHVARGYTSVSATVNFNKAGITMIAQTYGMNPWARGEYFTIDSSHTDGPAARITENCHIIGIGFKSAQESGDDVTASVVLDGSTAADAAYGSWLDRCRFTNWGDVSTEYGLYVSSTAACMISGCAFVGGIGNNLTAGIGMSSSGAWPVTGIYIIGNVFETCDYAIEALQAGGPTKAGLIHGNYLLPYGAGKFLNKNNQSGSTVMVSGNFLYTDVGAASFSHSADDMETDGWYVVGNEYETEDPGPT
jgi:hypothetical protein